MVIYELSFFYFEEYLDEDGEWEVKNVDEEFIAVYSTREKAERALEKFKTQPRFAGREEALGVYKCIVDKPEWTEGFYQDPKKDYSWKAVRERESLSK